MPEMHKSARDYLRAAEAAALLHVSPKTIGRWAKEGKVAHIVTLGGHRRFSRADVERLVRDMESASNGRPAPVAG
jgi:excisionase family DNA binding protein